MTARSEARPSTFSPEPRWPALVAALAAGGLYVAMPERLAAGPSWLLLSVVAVMVILAVITHRRGNHRLNQVVGFSVEALLTLAMVWSLAMLIRAYIVGRGPWGNMYEFSIAFAFGIVGGYLLLQRRYPIRSTSEARGSAS